MKPTKKLLVLVLGLVAVSVVTVLVFTATEEVATTPAALEQGEVVSTKEIVCGDETFVFNTVLLNDGTYFNDFYRNSYALDNFIVRLKPSRGGSSGAFIVLTAARGSNCDRLYLTTAIYETDVPIKGIYEWVLGKERVRELAVSSEFSNVYTPHGNKVFISPDGERILVAGQIGSETEVPCVHRTLLLLDLREDTSKILVQLSENESLDDGVSGLEPYCSGLNFGWQDENTVYYDVYSVTDNWSSTFIERRTLAL